MSKDSMYKRAKKKPKKEMTYRQRLSLHLGAKQNQRPPQFWGERA